MFGRVAQLNRVADYGSAGYRFESCRGHKKREYYLISILFFLWKIRSSLFGKRESLWQGAYCKKRIFQVQKTSETEQMLIRFFDLKKGLFLLFRAFSAITTVLISITTVLIGSALGTSRRL